MPEILGVAHDALFISGESVGGLGVCFCVLAKEDVVTVSRALELALFMDAKLDVGGTRSSGPRSRAATNT